MAGIDLRLQTIRRAILAFRDKPGRAGRLVRLDADEVLVAGDMHGNVEHLRALLGHAELAKHPRRHLVLQELIHGPFRYPDGSDKSHQLVDVVCALAAQYPRQVHYLVGNHELAQATNRLVMKHDNDLNAIFREGVDVAYGNRGGEVYALYLQLFAALPFALRTANRVFLSHTVPNASFDPSGLEADPTRPGDLEPGGSLYSLVWGRDVRPDALAGFLEKVDADYLVSGHIPCEEGFDRPSERHLILDTQGHPAAFALLPCDRPFTPDDLTACVRLL
jgi:hypothetical protein